MPRWSKSKYKLQFVICTHLNAVSDAVYPPRFYFAQNMTPYYRMSMILAKCDVSVSVSFRHFMLLIRRIFFKREWIVCNRMRSCGDRNKNLASTVSLWLRSITVEVVLWKVLHFVSCQKLPVTVVKVVQGERELVKTSDKVYCLSLVQRFMLRHSGLCRWGPFTITTHLCAWAWGGSHKMAHLAVKRIEIISLISHEAHIGEIITAVDSKSFGYILNYRFKVFLEILR